MDPKLRMQFGMIKDESPQAAYRFLAENYGTENVKFQRDEEGKVSDWFIRDDVTKPWKVVNPPGLDMGDVAEASGYIGSVGPGAVGGIIGGAIGGPPGAIAGGAVGDVVGSLGESVVKNQIQPGTVDAPTAAIRAGVQAGVGAAVPAAGWGVRRLVGIKTAEPSIRAALKEAVPKEVPVVSEAGEPVMRSSFDVLNESAKLSNETGIPLSAAQSVGTKAAYKLEAASARETPYSDKFAQFYEVQARKLQEAAGRVITGTGGDVSATEAGKLAAEGYANRLKMLRASGNAEFKKLFTEAQQLGNGAPQIYPANLEALVTEFEKTRAFRFNASSHETKAQQLIKALLPDDNAVALNSIKTGDGYPLANGTSDGLSVGTEIKNRSSIEASLSNYDVHDGIRNIKISDFESHKPRDMFASADDLERVERLTGQIRQSGRIDPLIVVRDEKGIYVLEGGHRLAALSSLGKKEVPALVVDDVDSLAKVGQSDDVSAGPIGLTVEQMQMALATARQIVGGQRALQGTHFNPLATPQGDKSAARKILEALQADLRTAAEDNPAAKRLYEARAARAAAGAADDAAQDKLLESIIKTSVKKGEPATIVRQLVNESVKTPEITRRVMASLSQIDPSGETTKAMRGAMLRDLVERKSLSQATEETGQAAAGNLTAAKLASLTRGRTRALQEIFGEDKQAFKEWMKLSQVAERIAKGEKVAGGSNTADKLMDSLFRASMNKIGEALGKLPFAVEVMRGLRKLTTHPEAVALSAIDGEGIRIMRQLADPPKGWGAKEIARAATRLAKKMHDNKVALEKSRYWAPQDNEESQP
jgi:hypothetical protein